jgi:hypothetical protein
MILALGSLRGIRHVLAACTASLLYAAFVAAPALSATLVETVSQGRWAIGSTANCSVPRKTYTLSLDGNNIVWRDGLGNIDVEALVSSGDSSFNGVTLQSIHSGAGERVGQTWSYFEVRPGLIRVQPAGKSPFMLVQC